MLTVDNFSAGYQDSRVLHNISLQAERDKLVGVSGKMGWVKRLF